MFPMPLCTCFWPPLSLPLMAPSVSWIWVVAWSGLRSGLPVLIPSQAAFSQAPRSVSSPLTSSALLLVHLWQVLSLGSPRRTTLLTPLGGSSLPNRIPSHTDPVNIFSQPTPSYDRVLCNVLERTGSIKAAGCKSATHFILNSM